MTGETQDTTMTITDAQIDAAARYLRETTQAGKSLTPWETTLKASKKKWLALARGTLEAAARATGRDHG